MGALDDGLGRFGSFRFSRSGLEILLMSSYVIPSRQGRPGDDPIFALSKAAREAKARGERVFDATLGALMDDEGRLMTMPALTKALRETPDAVLSAYAPIGGAPAFLEAVKDELLAGEPALRGRAVAVATPGGTGALRLAVTSFLDEGQALLTTSHFWSPYDTIAREHGRRVETFSMFAVGALDAAALDRELARQLEAQGRALLLLNDPCQNPTGYSMSDEDWAGVSRVLARHAPKGPITVLLDIAYAAFSPGAVKRPIAALSKLSGEVQVAFAWSASKSFLAYGQRVGALVVVPPRADDAKDVQAALVYSCRGTWSNCNHAGMSAVSRLLVDGPEKQAADDERLGATQLLAARVAAWNDAARPLGLEYPRYDGGFFVTVTSSDPKAHAARLRERGVYVVPLASTLRVALCSVPVADVAAVARALAETA